jgi:hypothetical protein
MERHIPALAQVGFRLAQGRDSGWFGDGSYTLTNGAQAMRITRFRGEEFLEVAFKEQPTEEQWFDVSELLTAFGAIAFEDIVDGRAIRHDLDFKIPAYLRLYSQIDAELVRNQAALQDRLHGVRQRAMQFAREKYGSKLKAQM